MHDSRVHVLVQDKCLIHEVRGHSPMNWMGTRPMLSTKATVNQYPGTVPRQAVMAFPAAVLYILSKTLTAQAPRQSYCGPLGGICSQRITLRLDQLKWHSVLGTPHPFNFHRLVM